MENWQVIIPPRPRLCSNNVATCAQPVIMRTHVVTQRVLHIRTFFLLYPRRARARVTVVGLSVCLSVCRRLFWHYRLRGGLLVISAATLLTYIQKAKNMEKGFPLKQVVVTRVLTFQYRDGSKDDLPPPGADQPALNLGHHLPQTVRVTLHYLVKSCKLIPTTTTTTSTTTTTTTTTTEIYSMYAIQTYTTLQCWKACRTCQGKHHIEQLS